MNTTAPLPFSASALALPVPVMVKRARPVTSACDSVAGQARKVTGQLALARVSILYNFYQAERRAGASPLIANERMHEFAKRLDANNQAT